MTAQSMTGYGRGTSGCFKIEIRSSNHKNIDININLPYYLFSHETEIRKIVKKKLNRGRIDVYVPKQDIEGIKLNVNRSLAREYYNALTSLKDELSINEEIGIQLLASQRDIFFMDEPEVNTDDLYQAVDLAIDDLMRSRSDEAKELMDDISERVHLFRTYLKAIEDQRQDFIRSSQNRLRDRIRELLDDKDVDDTRLVQEVAYLIEKSDITEEIVRIKSHLKHFEEVLRAGDTIGKKLDFLVQELRREINTISAKVQDAGISTKVVESKHELEKIKEQIQNLQ
ncbi:MAG: YicC family protein [Nitrospiraceae bacterium]|nr:MAG: YicC family protein [Nitrospiraceae bacterium]